MPQMKREVTPERSFKDHTAYVGFGDEEHDRKYWVSKFAKAVQDYESIETVIDTTRKRRNLQRVMMKALEQRKARRKLSPDLDRLITRVLGKVKKTNEELKALHEEQEFLTLYICALGCF